MPHRIALTVLLLLAASAGANEPPTPPPPPPAPDKAVDCSKVADGNYRNPQNCNSYIVCSAGTTEYMKCPGNFHFIESQNRCELPEVAHCVDFPANQPAP